MDKQLYYIQDSRSFVGNSPIWWGKDSGGYVCDLDKAGLYTKEEAMKQFESRNTDIPWKQEDVESAVKRIVDAQYLKKSDKDGFYSDLEKIQKDKRLQAQKEAEEYSLNEYVKQELFAICERINFDDVIEWVDFALNFDDIKDDLDWHEHYYPTAYNKSEAEIFEDLIKYDYIFKCSDCKKYFNAASRDEDEKSLCDGCGAEKWERDNG